MDQSEAHQHVDGPGNRVAPPAHGIRYLFSHIYISIFKTVLKFLRAISRERELPFRMEFSSVQNLCLHVSFVFSSSQRIVHFFFIFFFSLIFSSQQKFIEFVVSEILRLVLLSWCKTANSVNIFSVPALPIIGADLQTLSDSHSIFVFLSSDLK